MQWASYWVTASMPLVSTGMPASDRGLGSQALQELDLSKTALPDECLRHLKPFHSLAHLKLDDQRLGDAITDEGLRKIAHISGLHSLSLQGNCSITAQGLSALSSITSLRELDVRGCLNVQAHAALRHLQVCAQCFLLCVLATFGLPMLQRQVEWG